MRLGTPNASASQFVILNLFQDKYSAYNDASGDMYPEINSG